MQYSSPYNEWKNWSEDRFGQLLHEESKYYNEEIFMRVPSPEKVIEIGFGNVTFLAECRKRNVTVEGVEVNEVLLHRASKAGFIAHKRLEDIAGNKEFDAIIAFDVLEHLDADATVEMLRTASRLLKSKGKFIARFPNGDSPFGRIFQNGDVTHVQSIGKYKVIYFANQAEFNIEFMGAPAEVISISDPYRFFARSIRKYLRSLVEVFTAAVFYGQRVCLTSNYLIVLVKQ